MGLFTKKDPCAICGGKVKALIPWKKEGQLICNKCYGYVHLPKGVAENMTMEQFKAYCSFREENDVLRQRFQTTEQVDFGFFDDHFLFDTDHKLFCAGINLNNTIFEGSSIRSFTISEDDIPLYAGSAEGFLCYTSTVPDRIAEMAPMIQHTAMMMEMQRQMDQMEVDEPQGNSGTVRYYKKKAPLNYYQSIPEPFQKFRVEIRLDHPYWQTITADKKGPGFIDSSPSADDYLRLYYESAALMEKLARALAQVAFPAAPERRINRNIVGQAAASCDAVTEIQRFKDLLDQGIITEEEFAAKKKQLLDI